MAGGGPVPDRGVKKKRMRREDGPFATSTYYTISTLIVNVNLSVVVSRRWRSGGSAGGMARRKARSRSLTPPKTRDSG